VKIFIGAGTGLLGIVNATHLDEFMNVVQKELAKLQVTNQVCIMRVCSSFKSPARQPLVGVKALRDSEAA
jgi:hypothetical protein